MLTIGLPEFVQETTDRSFWWQFNAVNRIGHRNPLRIRDGLAQAFGEAGLPTLEDKVTRQTCQKGAMRRTIVASIQTAYQTQSWIVVAQRLVHIPQQIFQTAAAHTVAWVKVDLNRFFIGSQVSHRQLIPNFASFTRKIALARQF